MLLDSQDIFLIFDWNDHRQYISHNPIRATVLGVLCLDLEIWESWGWGYGEE